jgi:hypothetical protein
LKDELIRNNKREVIIKIKKPPKRSSYKNLPAGAIAEEDRGQNDTIAGHQSDRMIKGDEIRMVMNE